MHMVSHRSNANTLQQQVEHRCSARLTWTPVTGYTAAVRMYHLAAIRVPVAGSERLGPVLTLKRHLPVLDYYLAQANRQGGPTAEDAEADVRQVAHNPDLSEERTQFWPSGNVRLPHRFLRPLILRATVGEVLRLQVTNHLPAQPLSLALADDDFNIDITVGEQPPAMSGETRHLVWRCTHEGIFPIFNQAYPDAATRRCLLGVLIVESCL